MVGMDQTLADLKDKSECVLTLEQNAYTMKWIASQLEVG